MKAPGSITHLTVLLATSTYPGFPLYKKQAGSRHIPIMVLEPQETA